MYSIDIKTSSDNYTIIRVCDDEGIVCSYCGYDSWAYLSLLNDYNIDAR